MHNKILLKKEVLDAVKENDFIFINDILMKIAISSETFYRYFPKDSKDYIEIINLLRNNKINMKNGLRKKWYKSDNAGTQAYLYKILGTDEERKRMNSSYVNSSVNMNVNVKISMKDKIKQLEQANIQEVEVIE